MIVVLESLVRSVIFGIIINRECTKRRMDGRTDGRTDNREGGRDLKEWGCKGRRIVNGSINKE